MLKQSHQGYSLHHTGHVVKHPSFPNPHDHVRDRVHGCDCGRDHDHGNGLRLHHGIFPTANANANACGRDARLVKMMSWEILNHGDYLWDWFTAIFTDWWYSFFKRWRWTVIMPMLYISLIPRLSSSAWMNIPWRNSALIIFNPSPTHPTMKTNLGFSTSRPWLAFFGPTCLAIVDLRCNAINLSMDCRKILIPNPRRRTPLKNAPSNCARCQPNESSLGESLFSETYLRQNSIRRKEENEMHVRHTFNATKATTKLNKSLNCDKNQQS